MSDFNREQLIRTIMDCRRRRCARDGFTFDEKESRDIAEDVMSDNRNGAQFELLSRFVQLAPGMRLLEIGSGHGSFIALAAEHGLDAQGVEAEQEILAVSREILKFKGVSPDCVCAAFGEQLPFTDGSFDVVVSRCVLEHVRDVNAVIDESIRVVKRAGTVIHILPNYRSFFEGHFKCPWLPFLGHASGKWYLRAVNALRGKRRTQRDYDYLDTLQFTSLKTVRETRERHPEVEVVSTGVEVWRDRLAHYNMDARPGLGMIDMIIKTVRHLGLVRFVGWLGGVSGLYPSITLVLKKK